MPAVLLFFLVLWTLGFAALTAWSLLTGGTTFIWVWVVPLLLSIASWYKHARDYASRRRLSLTDRLAILDELVASELCSHEESATLRGQIEKLFAQGEM